MTLKGHATPAATQALTTRHNDLTYRALGETGWRVSTAGFGGYRIDAEEDIHRGALTQALRAGINLIDTSSNYADGGSERLIGEVVAALVDEGALRREEVVVVSKVGYLQGENFELSRQRKEEGNPFPDLVPYNENLEHCIHPEFIADQLTRSLERLGLETLDLYLLHNPEYYLNWAEREGKEKGKAQAEYYRRLTLAFRHLEDEVSQGRIRAYGVSSNTFPTPAEAYNFTSLSRLWELAQSGRKASHFHAIQLPMNLLEPGAAIEANQPEGKTVLDVARRRELGVLTNRPLNAIYQEALIRLADVPPPQQPARKFQISTIVETSVRIEQKLQEEILPALPLDMETRVQVLQYLAVGTALQEQWEGFGTYHNWRDVRDRFLLPRAQSGTRFLANIENPPVDVDSWLQSYINALNTLLAAVTAFYRERGHETAEAIKKEATAVSPEWDAETLSQTAIRAVRSTAGVTSVLVGMRRPAYVEDALAEVKRPVETAPRLEEWGRMAGALEQGT
jgi:hypothetical protein